MGPSWLWRIVCTASEHQRCVCGWSIRPPSNVLGAPRDLASGALVATVVVAVIMLVVVVVLSVLFLFWLFCVLVVRHRGRHFRPASLFTPPPPALRRLTFDTVKYRLLSLISCPRSAVPAAPHSHPLTSNPHHAVDVRLGFGLYLVYWSFLRITSSSLVRRPCCCRASIYLCLFACCAATLPVVRAFDLFLRTNVLCGVVLCLPMAASSSRLVLSRERAVSRGGPSRVSCFISCWFCQRLRRHVAFDSQHEHSFSCFSSSVCLAGERQKRIRRVGRLLHARSRHRAGDGSGQQKRRRRPTGGKVNTDGFTVTGSGSFVNHMQGSFVHGVVAVRVCSSST